MPRRDQGRSLRSHRLPSRGPVCETMLSPSPVDPSSPVGWAESRPYQRSNIRALSIMNPGTLVGNSTLHNSRVGMDRKPRTVVRGGENLIAFDRRLSPHTVDPLLVCDHLPLLPPPTLQSNSRTSFARTGSGMQMLRPPRRRDASSSAQDATQDACHPPRSKKRPTSAQTDS